ncbi:unnamed protein product [Thlaspi arvense]|uniref:Protein EMBRYONIC FLOWER 1 n=1 Tax=Thlaspi arvense TaxID=13288 RepID=A0AAU9RKS3_THLAR|nr:unnamed protein product [Thlaspi arvense]
MEPSIKINSISIDLADAADEIDAGKCQHFSILGFLAEIRERDHKKCWPFPEDTTELRNHQSYSLPSLPVVKSRWWGCASCIRDLNMTNESDCRLQSHSREQKLDADALAIPSKRGPNSLIVTDKREKNNDVQTGNAANLSFKVAVLLFSLSLWKQIYITSVSYAATLLKKVRRRAKDASTVKIKSSKFAKVGKRSREKANISRDFSWKESREEAVNGGETFEAVTAFGSSEIAGVVDDTPDKTIKKSDKHSHVSAEQDECDANVSPESRNLLGLHRRKTRKVRLLSELLSNRSREALSKKESVRGRKRKSCGDEECSRPAEMTTNYASRILSTIGKTSENASKSCDSEDNTVSGAESRPSVENQSTDSGFEKEPIIGKQRNKRFQVVEEDREKDPYDYASPARSSFPGKELVSCTLHTQRTEKDLSLAKKRKRKAMVDNNKSTIIDFSNDMDDANLRKPDNFPQVCPRDTMPQSTRDFLNSKWLDSSFAQLSAPDGHFNKCTPQVDDRQVFPLPLQDKMQYKEGDRAMLKGLGTNHFRNFGSSFKPTNADGCLRTGASVNFSSNRDTIGPSSSLNDKLRHTSFTEAADTSRAPQKDISTAHGKGKEVVVQELPGATRSQSKTCEHIDDIPMEIVELMAKNQYERCLPDREEDKQPSQATTSLSKNALLIDLNETYDNSMENTIRQPKEGHFMAGKQSSLEFFPMNQFGQPYNVPSAFGISPLTRDNQLSSIKLPVVVGPNQQTGHNCQWLGNVPTTMANHQNPSASSFRVLRACNTCQGAQQQQYREASQPIWPSPMTSTHPQKPVSLNTPQKFMDPSTKLDNPNTQNLNFAGNMMQKRIFKGVSSKSSDSYSNESSIPAMHLLSLMDPRLRSNVPNDQSRNTEFVKRPQAGDCNKTPYSTKQWPFDLYSRRVTSETPRESFSIIPPVGTSSISFHSEKSPAENVDFTLQAPWNHRHHQEKKPKRKDRDFAPVYNNSHQQKPTFTSSSSGSDPGKFQLLGASDSMMLPLKFHMTDNAKKNKTKKAQSSNPVSVSLPTSISGPYVCTVNRNPADFTIPDAPGNVYMIKGEDFKVRKLRGSGKKPSLCKQDALKQNNNSIAPSTENA